MSHFMSRVKAKETKWNRDKNKRAGSFGKAQANVGADSIGKLK
jgi:hypothetical protein